MKYLFSINKIQYYDVFSILLFSLLANYMLTLNIDFGLKVNYFKVIELICISISAIVFFTVVNKLKKYAADATREYENEKDREKQAENPIDSRLQAFIIENKKSILSRLFISIALFISFLFSTPLMKWCLNS